MHWIIQNNLYEEESFNSLVATLERFDIPHDVVKVVPFSDPENELMPAVNPSGLVMVCGSLKLADIAKRRGWMPGSFMNENHDFTVWGKAYGNNTLNYEASVCKFGEVPTLNKPFFIRPILDTKSFPGKVTDWPEFEDWQHRVINLKETYTSLNADTTVLYAPVQKIKKEYRFFVVNGRVVTGSVYKIGTQVTPNGSGILNQEAIDFAQLMVSIWTPASAFVIDVCLIEEQGKNKFKIVEINCINAAGFYGIDVQKFVMAIEYMTLSFQENRE